MLAKALDEIKHVAWLMECLSTTHKALGLIPDIE